MIIGKGDAGEKPVPVSICQLQSNTVPPGIDPGSLLLEANVCLSYGTASNFQYKSSTSAVMSNTYTGFSI